MRLSASFSSTTFDNPHAVRYQLSLAGILLAGLALRMYAALVGEGYHYFAIGDEILGYEYALGFLHGDSFAYYLQQPTFAGGQSPGPTWTLIWVGLLKLGGGSVHRAIAWMAVFNSLGVFLVYRLARQFLQPRFALLACLLFALGPWPVYHSAGIWNPMTLVVVGCGLFLSLWRVTRAPDSKWIVLVCFIAIVLPQFHMIGLFYLPAVAFMLWISPARLHRAGFIVGSVLGMAMYLPYLIGEFTHGWSNTKHILAGNDPFTFGVFKIISAPLTVLSNFPGRWVSDDLPETIDFATQWFGSSALLLTLNLLSFLVAIVSLVFFFTHFARAIKSARGSLRAAFAQQPAVIYIGLMLLLPVLLFTLTGHNFSTRYTVLTYPLLFLLPAYFIQHATPNGWRRFVVYVLPLNLVAGIYLCIAFYTHVNHLINNGTYLACSFHKLESLRAIIKTHAGDNAWVQIDNSRYGDHAAIDKEYIGGNALMQYFKVYEKYLGHPGAPPAITKTYRVDHDTHPEINPQRIAYRGNGVIIYLE
ncbi:MAG: glycosyltransferase family 39 protein [Gammaproteobacteria bacterium]|nr:glycosyltransferase family 39 protein [Gammaproteobacteria bacterium]